MRIVGLLPGHLLRCIAVVFLTIFFAQPTAAYGKTIIGAGVITCGKWLSDRQSNNYSSPNWVLGFLSGVAVFSGLDPLNNLDADAVRHWMDNYCRAHPLVDITDALRAFVKEQPR